MKRIVNVIFDLRVYLITFFICNLCTMSIFTQWIYNLTIPLCIIWGGLICIHHFFKEKFKKDILFFIAFGFCISYFLVILFRSKGYANDMAQLVCVAIYFFLCVCAFSDFDKKDRNKVCYISCFILFIFNIFVSIGSFIMLLTKYYNEVTILGETYLIGLIPRGNSFQLHGICGSPSQYCILTLLALVSSIFIWKRNKNRGFRICIVFVDIITWFCMVGCNAFYLILLYIVFAFVFLFCNVIKKRKKESFTFFISIIVIALLYKGSFGILDFGMNKIQQLGQTVSVESESESKDKSESKDESESKHKIEVQDERKKAFVGRSKQTSTLNVRISIWTEAIKLFADNPFGIANSNICVKVFYGVPDYPYYNLHNGFLTVLVASGIQGFALLLIFGIILLIKAVKHFMKINDTFYEFILSLCIAILAGEMVNSCFLLGRGLLYITLWILLGYIYGECKQR